MDTTQREMFFSDEFFPKFVERGVIILDCIKNKTEILESDFEVLEEYHRIWFEGRLGWTKSTLPEMTATVTEVGLFDSIPSGEPITFDDARDKLIDGKEIDTPSVEPTNEEK